jgi:hypothetical protein
MFKPNPQRRAADAWKRIKDKPSSLVLVRNKVSRDAQTVRVEISNGTAERGGNAGQSAMREAIVFGVRDHRDPSVPNTDIQRGDLFTLSGAQYRVMTVVHTIGEIQAVAEEQR